MNAPLTKLDIGSPEKSTEEKLTAEQGLEAQGPVVVLSENGGGAEKNRHGKPRKRRMRAERNLSGGTEEKHTGDGAGASARGRGRRSRRTVASPSKRSTMVQPQIREQTRGRKEEEEQR